MSDEARTKLLREHFRMFARGLIERTILWWSSAEYINSLIRVEGVEHFEALKANPPSCLRRISSAWMPAASGSRSSIDTVCMYANQKNVYLTELLLKKRTRFGNQRLYSRQQGLRPILKGMRAGMPFSIRLTRTRA